MPAPGADKTFIWKLPQERIGQKHCKSMDTTPLASPPPNMRNGATEVHW
jgi:hypothetical protein